MGRPQDAEPLFHRAIELSRNSGNLRSEGYATGNLGEMYHSLGRQEAIQTLERALEIHARAGNREQEAWISTRIAAIHARASRLDEALATYSRALNALEGTDRREWTGGVWSKLVGVYLRLGRHRDAQLARANMQLALRGLETPAAQQYRRDADTLLA
jgi:tetratricopeptide (TPR) repeat protein